MPAAYRRPLLLLAVLLPLLAVAALLLPRAVARDDAGASPVLGNLSARLDPSDPRRGEPIRVLFYGQSITRQDWWRGAAAHLQRRFPQQAFEFRNLAIGGHDAQRLVRLVASDVLPYQPDLVVFHVYGDPAALAEAIRQIRSGTVADVLIANDHLVHDDEVAEERRRWALVNSGVLRRVGTATGWLSAGSTWQAWRNHVFLPDLAARYGLGLLDVRDGWARTVAGGGGRAADYLADAIHLNDRGIRLMERLVVDQLDQLLDRHLVPAPMGSALRAPRVRAVPADCGAPAAVRGYRTDLVVAGLPPPDGPAVRLDGERIETLAALHWVDRATPLPGTDFPALLRVRLDGPRVVPGRYTVELLQRLPGGAYLLRVSAPGAGAPMPGRTDEPLVLPRQGVRIDPADWNIAYAEQVYGIADFSGHAVGFGVHGPAGGPRALRPVDAASGRAAVTVFRATANASRSVCLPGWPQPGAQLVEYRAPLSCRLGGWLGCRLERNGA